MKEINCNILYYVKSLINILSLGIVLSIGTLYSVEATAWGSSPNIVALVYVFVCCYTDYLIRRHFSNYINYTLMHLLLIVPLPFLMPYIGTPNIVVLLAVISILTSLGKMYWKKENASQLDCTTEVPMEMLVIIIPIYLHSYYKLSTALSNYILYSAIVFVAFCFIKQFITRLINYVLTVDKSRSVPINSIVRSTGICIGIILVAAILMTNVFSSLFTGDRALLSFIKLICGGTLSLFSNFFGLFRAHNDYSIAEDTVTVESQTGDLTTDVVKNLSANELIVAISNVVKVIFLIAAAVFVIYLIIQYIRANLHKEYQNIDLADRSTIKAKDDVKRTKTAFSLFHPSSNNDKVRKMFKKKVLYYKDTMISVHQADSPQDLADRIKYKTGNDYNELADIYEHARYGDGQVSDEDVSKAHKIYQDKK